MDKKTFQVELRKNLSTYINGDVVRSKQQFSAMQARLMKRVKEQDSNALEKVRRVRLIYKGIFD